MRFSVFPLYAMFCLNSVGGMTVLLTNSFSVWTEPETVFDEPDCFLEAMCWDNTLADACFISKGETTKLALDCIDTELIDPEVFCTEEWDPVCGCDGVTYSNSCYATYFGGVTYFEEGECGSDPCIDENLIEPYPCPFIWDPVCGCDGVTYGNACEAETVGGVLSYTAGECGQPTPCEPIIEAWPSEVTGVWNFMVYDVSNPWADPFSEDALEWDGNGEVVGEGPNGSTQVAFWGTNDFLFVACANVWCGEEWVQVCWDTPNASQEMDECENVVIALNAEWGSTAVVEPLELELVLSITDTDLELDLSQVLVGGEISESISFWCWPVGYCFELEAAVANLDEQDVAVLEIAVIVDEELPSWQNVLDVLTSGEASWTGTFGVDVLDGCEQQNPDWIPNVFEPQITITPNPVHNSVQFLGWTHGTATVVLRNALGQTLMRREEVRPGEVLMLQSRWRGVVLAEISGDGWVVRPVMVVR